MMDLPSDLNTPSCIYAAGTHRQSTVSSSPTSKIVKSLRNTSISIQIAPNATLADIKQILYMSEGIPPHHQRLLFGCRESELAESDMTLLLRLLGGNPKNNPKIMPVIWWLGFARSYQDGQTRAEGRIYHALSGFIFEGQIPINWHSNNSLSNWQGVTLICSEVEGVRVLYLWNSGLKYIPDSVKYLSFLTNLRISKNLLISLPKSIGSSTSLTVLNVCENRLTSLPASIGNLSALAELYVSDNRLTELPESICWLTLLKFLYVNHNQLTTFPARIGNLASLTHLYADNNLLTVLPVSFLDLPLERLSLNHNPITETIEGKVEIKKSFGKLGENLLIK